MVKQKVCVIGAINLDISAIASGTKIAMQDSNIGKVSFSAGGVAYNIARNLSLLSVDVLFISVFGDDSQAAILKSSCVDYNIDTSKSLFLEKERSSTYVCINDADDDMLVAINDMNIYEHLTPEYIQTIINDINTCTLCVFDTNIPQSTIEFLAKNCTAPLFSDPVSTVKAQKLQNILPFLHTFTPNLMEAQILCKKTDTLEKNIKSTAQNFLDQGVKNIYISLGQNGIFAATKEHSVQFSSHRIGTGNTTGAGDSQMAAIIWSFLQGKNIKETAKAAIAIASFCMEANEAINTHISEGVLNERILKVH